MSAADENLIFNYMSENHLMFVIIIRYEIIM